MNSLELENKVDVLELRIQRIERQLTHCVLVNENLRLRVARLSTMVVEISSSVLPILEAVKETIDEPPTPSLKDLCTMQTR